MRWPLLELKICAPIRWMGVERRRDVRANGRCEGSTAAVASWIGGDSPDAARAAGWAATQSFGQLAAQQAVSLTEVTTQPRGAPWIL